MTSDYRRDHQGTVPGNDEWLMISPVARGDITTLLTDLNTLYPTPTASEGEVLAAKRALARYLIDSGKASSAGVLS